MINLRQQIRQVIKEELSNNRNRRALYESAYSDYPEFSFDLVDYGKRVLRVRSDSMSWGHESIVQFIGQGLAEGRGVYVKVNANTNEILIGLIKDYDLKHTQLRIPIINNDLMSNMPLVKKAVTKLANRVKIKSTL